MTHATEIVSVQPSRGLPAPALIVAASATAQERFLEFFAAQIRNRNTRAAYLLNRICLNEHVITG